MKRNILLSFLLALLSALALQQTAQAATFCVDNTGDGPAVPGDCPVDCVGPTGNCTLRDAVEAADMNPGADMIDVPPGTYTLSEPPDSDLQIDEAVTINGGGEANTIIQWVNPDPAQRDRVFENEPTAIGTIIQNLTVQGGSTNSNGGCIQNHGGITLNNVTIRDCETRDADNDGGGFSNDAMATAELNNVTIIGNRSSGSDGGGIFTQGSSQLILLNSSVSGNMAADDGGGIDNRGVMVIENSTIDGNSATEEGIGIRSAGIMVMNNSTVSRNIVEMSVTGATDPIEGEGFNRCGGGIRAGLANTVITNSTISNNSTVDAGGGICFFFNINGAVVGSGFGPASLFNVTIADNEVTGPNGFGGGIACENCFNGSAIGGQGLDPIIANTLIAQNSAAMGPDCEGFYDSAGFNLIGDLDNPNICIGFMDGISNDQVGGSGNPIIDPVIGDLQNNGGPTETRGLLTGSPAIDMANDVDGCEAPNLEELMMDNFVLELLTTDQRFFPRPIAVLDPNTPICDIGAFEFQAFGFTVTKDDGLGGEEIPVDTQFDYTITVTNNGPGAASDVTLDDPLPSGMGFVSVASSQGACAAIGDVVGCDLGDLAVGETATITVTVIATEDGSFTNIVTITLNNPSQQQLTETAQVTTLVGGIFVFGSGCNCSVQPGAPVVGMLKGSLLLWLVMAAGLIQWRRQGNE